MCVHEEGVDDVSTARDIGLKVGASVGGLVEGDAGQEEVIEGTLFGVFNHEGYEHEEVCDGMGEVTTCSHAATHVEVAWASLVFLFVWFVCDVVGDGALEVDELPPGRASGVGFEKIEDGDFLVNGGPGSAFEGVKNPGMCEELGAEGFGHSLSVELDGAAPATLVNEGVPVDGNALAEGTVAFAFVWVCDEGLELGGEGGERKDTVTLVVGGTVREESAVP